jgi:hypothetical protein
MSIIVSRRIPQSAQPDQTLNAEVAQAERPGIRAVVKVQAAAFVASTAMQNANMLSRSADVAFRISPMGEDIYRAILMAYGSVAVAEIQALGLQDRGRF